MTFINKYIEIFFLILVTSLSILYFLNFFSDFNLYTNSTHVLQSISYLNGFLYLPLNPNNLIGDLHFFNGAWYSAWGSGIPILQLPFHFISDLLFGIPFPDILIFIFFSLISTNILYKFLKKRIPKILSLLLSYIIIFCSLFWIVSYRFLIYEESAAYFIIFTINSFVYFIESIESKDKKYIPYLVLNIFITILIRPTALFTAILVFIFFIFKNKNFIKPYIFYFIFPGILYAFLNFMKSGTIFPSGLATTHPGVIFELFNTRIGSPCFYNTNFSVYLERFFQIFSAFFMPLSFDEAKTSINCVTMLEDSKALKKPWFSIYILYSILLSFVYLLYRRKFFEFLFIFFGIFIVLTIYTFLTNGAAYRYNVDFFFYIYFTLYTLMQMNIMNWCPSINLKKYLSLKFSLDALLKIMIVFIFVYHFYPTSLNIIKHNGGATLYKNWIINDELKWNISGNFPISRKCKNDVVGGFGIYDKMGWQNNCKISRFLNIYLSVPNDKKWYKIKLNGSNIPKKLDVRINGKFYKDFDVTNDMIYIGKMITNNLNLFLYDPSHKNNVYVEEVSLR